MSLNRSGIERQSDGIFTKFGQNLEDRTPSPAFGPTIEAIVDGRVRTIFTRTIAPSSSRLQHVNDAADDAPIVLALRPGQSRRQVRLNTRPLPVVQPKQTLSHSHTPESVQGVENHMAVIRYRP
jgi:hypothetical protein